MDVGKKSGSNLSSPLAVISLFISLTEIVTGIAITQATGGIQIALTSFVIVFPFSIASIFFYILWHKNYVYYPPTEFGKETDVYNYVNAMQSRSLDESKIMELVKDSISEGVSNVRDLENQDVEAENRIIHSVVSKASEKAIDSFRNKVVTINAEEINGKTWVLPYYPERTVQEFLDSIWSELRDNIKPYQYGKTWIIKKIASNGKNIDLHGQDFDKINNNLDWRSLEEAGIYQGDRFKVLKLK